MMRSKRKNRMYMILLLVLSVVVAGLLGAWAIGKNTNYLLTPSQVATGEADRYATFRLGGMVKAGSIRRAADSLRIDFTVVDADGSMEVTYTGIAPDLFRDNQSVIATGHLENGRFIASELLARHDETYMPRELQDAMEEAHQKSNINPAADGA